MTKTPQLYFRWSSFVDRNALTWKQITEHKDYWRWCATKEAMKKKFEDDTPFVTYSRFWTMVRLRKTGDGGPVVNIALPKKLNKKTWLIKVAEAL
jgi:hypothetical protein